MFGGRRGVLSLTVLLVVTGCTGSSSADSSTTTELSSPLTTATTMPPTTTTRPATTTTAPTTTTVPATTTTTIPPDPLLGLGLEILATGFSRPTFVAAFPGEERLAVVEAVGRIRVVDEAGIVQPEPFLNIRNKVGSV